MKINKNERGGFRIDGEKDFVLTKNKNHFLVVGKGIKDSDIVNFTIYINCQKNKWKVLIAVFKWLYRK